MSRCPDCSVVSDVMGVEEIPAGQQWTWAGRGARRSLRLTAEMEAAIDRRAASQNVPWSAVARHLIAEGIRATEAGDEP